MTLFGSDELVRRMKLVFCAMHVLHNQITKVTTSLFITHRLVVAVIAAIQTHGIHKAFVHITDRRLDKITECQKI